MQQEKRNVVVCILMSVLGASERGMEGRRYRDRNSKRGAKEGIKRGTNKMKWKGKETVKVQHHTQDKMQF